MADFIKQIQEMQDKMVAIKDLFLERDAVLADLARIDGRIRTVLNMDIDADGNRSPRCRPHPNKGTDAYRIVEVLGEKPTHKDEIIAALKKNECDIPPKSVAYYLTNYGCFQKVKRGYWKYLKP